MKEPTVHEVITSIKGFYVSFIRKLYKYQNQIFGKIASSLIWNVELKSSYLNSYDLDLEQYPLVEIAQKLNHGTILLLELKLNPKPWKKMLNIGSSSLNKQIGLDFFNICQIH
jgi:hypothetical protein